MRLNFQHAQFQVFLAKLRRRISDVWRAAFCAAGLYQPISKAERTTRTRSVVTFKGDIPLLIKDRVREQGLQVFVQSRPVFEHVDNLVITANGAGWKDGVLYERYSAKSAGLRMLLSHQKPAETQSAPVGIVIQSAHVDTYGDWVSEYLSALARMKTQAAVDAPIFLPEFIARKPYVNRDLGALGHEIVSVDRPMRIEHAIVLRQQKHFVYFLPEELRALRAMICPAPAAPAPGSVLYLSRFGERSEVADRSYPSEIVENIILERGGRVLRTGETNLETYKAAARDAETVVFDHGSAFFNALYWRPKRAVEIVSDAWWTNAFLMFAHADGISDYIIVRGDDGPPENAAEKILAALDRPIEA